MRQIVAFGGGGFSMESGNPLLDDYVLGLTGAAEPRVCFLPTASGDADHYLVRFYNAFRERARPSHVSLFRRERGVTDVRRHLLAQDLIYVGGGSLLSLLGVWRAHGIDSILREAWEAGVVLCGLSAGSLCWFAEAVSGYHDEVNRVEGLGFLPHSNAVHYSDGDRRAAFHRHLLDGMPAGYAAEDGAALRFVGDELVEVVSSRPEARAYRLERRGPLVLETRLATRYLDSTVPVGGAARLRDRGRLAPMGDAGRILACGGHDFDRRSGNEAITDLIVELAGGSGSRICLLPTASGDPEDQITRFRRAVSRAGLPSPSVISLFRLGDQPGGACGEELLSQDAIFVGGGSMVNLLAIWRAHGARRAAARVPSRRASC